MLNVMLKVPCINVGRIIQKQNLIVEESKGTLPTLVNPTSNTLEHEEHGVNNRSVHAPSAPAINLKMWVSFPRR